MNEKKFKIIFFNSMKAEILINDKQALRSELTKLTETTTPESINLVSPNSDIFTIAIGNAFGFIQFERASPDSSYLIAIDKEKSHKEDYRYVDAGGTPTPIPERACLPVEIVIEIALFYYDNMKIPKNIDWEEI